MTSLPPSSPDFSTLQKRLHLTDSQTEEAKNLALDCWRHDSIRLSYPADPQENACHYLLYSDEGSLCAALAMVPCGETAVECTAFTHPAFRRKGCFDALLSRALEDFEEYDIFFPVSGTCPDTLNTLEALGAQLDTTEYQMEWTSQTAGSTQKQRKLSDSQEKSDQSDNKMTPAFFLTSSPSPDDSETLCWSFHPGISESPSSDAPAGTFLTTWTGNGCVCLHQVEILPAFRSQGLGTAMIRLFLVMAAQKNISRVILQVSADNLAALTLYKKTGFRITETLSFYFY